MHETIAPDIRAGSYVSTTFVVRMTGFASLVRAYFSQVHSLSLGLRAE
jgi:hypothetical protein